MSQQDGKRGYPCARARFSTLETRNFISPSSLIILLRAVIELQRGTLIKGVKAEAEAAVSTQVGDYRRGNFFLVTDLVFFHKVEQRTTRCDA